MPGLFKRLFAAAAATVIAAFPAGAEKIDGIAAVVNGGVVTLSELQERMGFSAPSRSGDAEESTRRELESLIDEKLVEQEAARLGIQVSSESVKEEFGRMKSSFPSEKLFFEFLEEQGMTRAAAMARFRARLLLRKVAESEIMPSVEPPGQSEALEFYRENPGMFTEPRRLRLFRIHISGADGSISAAERKIAGIREEISGGADFRKLARKHSDGHEAAEGGDMGFILPAELLPEEQAGISGLSPGETSGVISTGAGFSVFMVEGVREERLAEFDKVHDAVARYLFQLKMEREVEAWLERLKSGAHIEVKL